MVLNGDRIEAAIKEAERASPSGEDIARVLSKAAELKGLSVEEAAVLLTTTEPAAREEIKRKAREVKRRVFGSRIVLFAPLYLTSYCTNGCLYCGFRSSADGMERKALSTDEIVTEARALEAKGFKRTLLVLGEDPRWGADHIVKAVRAIYDNTGMRIVHVNAPPMKVTELRKLKAAGVGLFQVFQETYHRPTYEWAHPWGNKKNYDWRISVMDRAIEAGFGDVGIGTLLGLYDFRFDALSVIAHSNYLYRKFKAHAHTISIPRLRPAPGAGLEKVPHPVSDSDMELIVSVYRLSVPSAGVVVTTRESAELRASLIECGASQVSAASSTAPGGYASGEEGAMSQFKTTDHRSLEEVMASIAGAGSVPSLCTACYRVGRVGEDFTGRTTAGEMGKFCDANALLTLKEYLLRQKPNGNAALFSQTVDSALRSIKDPKVKEKVIEKLKELEEGESDRFL